MKELKAEECFRKQFMYTKTNKTTNKIQQNTAPFQKIKKQAYAHNMHRIALQARCVTKQRKIN